ncbi:hypothetical protein HanIR_Chr04g0164081 [Helianthus annuus]|nr:hypothetical protein HanIR_Chr04g0164081 [Helianthus annuus]
MFLYVQIYVKKTANLRVSREKEIRGYGRVHGKPYFVTRRISRRYPPNVQSPPTTPK